MGMDAHSIYVTSAIKRWKRRDQLRDKTIGVGGRRDQDTGVVGMLDARGQMATEYKQSLGTMHGLATYTFRCKHRYAYRYGW